MATHLYIRAALAAACMFFSISALCATSAQVKRPITIDDLIALRDIDTLALAPDGRKYAILQRQAEPVSNTYRNEWFVSTIAGGPLRPAGDGGEVRLRQSPAGRRTGIIVGSPASWSPDSTRLAYTALRHNAVQLYFSEAESGTQRRLTNNAADVRDFVWASDTMLIYTVGEAREVLEREAIRTRHDGISLEQFQFHSEIVFDAQPSLPIDSAAAYWTVELDGHERPATEPERELFQRLHQFRWGRSQPQGVAITALSGAAAPPVISPHGQPVWLVRADDKPMPLLRVRAALDEQASKPIACRHEACSSRMFGKLWWAGSEVILWRKQDTNLVENAFYAWTPAGDKLRLIYHQPGDEFKTCELTRTHLICVRQTPTRPDHVVSIELRSGALNELADVNPHLREVELGKIERFKYQAAPDAAGYGYPHDMFGYVIYPPGFDPARRYPVIIAPYGAPGFRRGDVGDEQPMFVYAANGFVVISSQFPVIEAYSGNTHGVRELYSTERGLPHLTMCMESTWRALDTIAARGFIDEQRIGIGGLSHGAFVPLHMLQRYDRLAAVAIAGPGWSQTSYYSATPKGLTYHSLDWPEERAFWQQIDIADHVEQIEAPLLVNYADREFFADWRLPRSMADAGRAFDAYIFANEFHIKWQPAHRYAIYKRNLDWFRFWLQDIEDRNGNNAQQYKRWRELRKLQCENRRSVRDYCAAEVMPVEPAR